MSLPSTSQSQILLAPSLKPKPPRTSFGSRTAHRQVQFLHPGYDDSRNVLLALPALDSGGIHHETARIACAILANSAWHGFLSATRGGRPLTQGPDEILMGDSYYFHVDSNTKYAVVPSFDNFLCPTTLPRTWASTPIPLGNTFDVRARDPTCRITASADVLETAHIIPTAQEPWWQRNLMFRHTARPGNSQSTTCPDNSMRVRVDLHRLWDDHVFTVVPKAGKWLVHFLQDTATAELTDKYHNLELQPLTGVGPMFFLCRFALAVFCKSLFLTQNTDRMLVLVSEDGKKSVEEVSAAKCRTLYGTARARSASPTKRSRSRVDQNDDDGDFEGSGSEEPELRSADFEDEDEEDEEEEQRGRQRKRSWSPLTPPAYSNGHVATDLERPAKRLQA